MKASLEMTGRGDTIWASSWWCAFHVASKNHSVTVHWSIKTGESFQVWLTIFFWSKIWRNKTARSSWDYWVSLNLTCHFFCRSFFLLLQEDGVSCHHRDVSQMFLASGEWPWGEKLLRTVMLTWAGGITTQDVAESLGRWIRMDDLWKMKMHLDDMRWYDRIHVLVSDFMLRWSNKHESVKRSISMPALDSQETSLSKHYINFLGIVPGDFYFPWW